VGTTEKNLVAAKGGEDFEVDEMYPAYLSVAELQEEKAATRSMNYALEAEKIHSRYFAAAEKALNDGEDIVEAKALVCPVCGFTTTNDEVPDRCPICNTHRKKFQEFNA
jgi:rubrerythrin